MVNALPATLAPSSDTTQRKIRIRSPRASPSIQASRQYTLGPFARQRLGPFLQFEAETDGALQIEKK
jgi:hypothetical protein